MTSIVAKGKEMEKIAALQREVHKREWDLLAAERAIQEEAALQARLVRDRERKEYLAQVAQKAEEARQKEQAYAFLTIVDQAIHPSHSSVSSCVASRVSELCDGRC